MTRLSGCAAIAAAAALLASAGTAEAHIVAARLGDFYSGALHPLSDIQDLALWAALGMLAASLGAAKGRWLVPVFPLGLVAGLILRLDAGLPPAGAVAEAGILAAVGLLLAAQVRMPAALLCAVAFGLALMRGAANAAEVAPETNLPLFAAGLAAAGYVAMTLTMALTLVFRGDAAAPSTAWRGIAIRAAGSWIAAIGIMMAAFSLSS